MGRNNQLKSAEDKFVTKTEDQLKGEVKQFIKTIKKQMKSDPTFNDDYFKKAKHNSSSIFHEPDLEENECDGDCENCDHYELADDGQEEIKRENLPPEVQKLLKQYEKIFEAEKVRIQKFNNQELADWIIRKHDSYISALLNSGLNVSEDFLLGKTDADRIAIVGYVRDLFIIFQSYECKITKETIKILKSKGYKKLVQLLEMLNFIDGK